MRDYQHIKTTHFKLFIQKFRKVNTESNTLMLMKDTNNEQKSIDDLKYLASTWNTNTLCYLTVTFRSAPVILTSVRTDSCPAIAERP